MENLEDLWSKLSLTEMKLEAVKVHNDWVSETFFERKKCLIGQALTRKMVNLEVKKIVFS